VQKDPRSRSQSPADKASDDDPSSIPPEIQSAALSRAMADQDDLLRRSKVFRELFIERTLLRNTLALIVSSHAVDQVAKSIRIIRPRGIFALNPVAIDILVDSSQVVIDDNNDAHRLHWIAWMGAKVARQ